VAAEGEGGGSAAVPGPGRAVGRLLPVRGNDQDAHEGVGGDSGDSCPCSVPTTSSSVSSSIAAATSVSAVAAAASIAAAAAAAN
jgi:hypothetical protein